MSLLATELIFVCYSRIIEQYLFFDYHFSEQGDLLQKK